MLMTLVLAFTILMTNESCNYSASTSRYITLSHSLTCLFFPFTNMFHHSVCHFFTAAEGVASAASDLSSQVNTVTKWMGLKSVDITPQELTSYCASVSYQARDLSLLLLCICVCNMTDMCDSFVYRHEQDHGVSTWFWRMTFIWIAAATLCQVCI